MKIKCISMYRVMLPITGGAYKMSGGRVTRELDNTIVSIETDNGLVGWGESCPFGPDYLPAFAEGARAAITRLAPCLIGLDPRNHAIALARMDTVLYGHGYAKSALDIALWDLLAKTANLPLYMLLGGRHTERVPIRSGIPTQVPEEVEQGLAQRRQRGYRHFSLKLGDDVAADIDLVRAVAASLRKDETVSVDANCGWNLPDALRLVSAISDLPVMVEQPCATYEDCRTVARSTSLPIVLDECIDSFASLARAHEDGVGAVINIKIERCDGMTGSRLIRDAADAFGYSMYVQEVGGAEITFAATVHLAHGVLPHRFVACTHPKVDVVTADGAPTIEDGDTWVSESPGLGVEPRMDVLGEALAVIT